MARLRSRPTVDKIYRPRGRRPCIAVDRRLTMDVGHGEIVGAARLVRLRQDLDAAHDRRLRGGDATARSALGDRPIHDAAAGGAQRGHGLRGLFALSAADHARQHRLRAAARRGCRRAEVDAAGRRDRRAARDRATSSTAIPAPISGGQQQRASLARALVRRAPISICSTSRWRSSSRSCAPILRGRIKDYLHRAPHDDDLRHPRPDRGDRACRPDRRDGGGRAAAVSRTPRELKERPANLFVAQLHRRAADERLSRPRSATAAGARVVGCPTDASRSASDWPANARRCAIAVSRDGSIARHPAARGSGVGEPQGVPATVVSNQWLGDQTHLARRHRRLLARRWSHDRTHRRAVGRARSPVSMPPAAICTSSTPATGAAIWRTAGSRAHERATSSSASMPAPR